MNWIMPLSEIRCEDRPKVGAECSALALLAQKGIHIPETVCITTEVYDKYVTLTELREAIHFELNRKDLKEMRWEEIWDASLRIRNLFVTKPIPEEIHQPLRNFLRSRFKNKAVVVQASSPCEAPSIHSSTPLHESFADIHSVDSILDCMRIVWASLWSDAALLYHRELGLHAGRSNMAVVVQEIVPGEKSGFIFGMVPQNPACMLVESVYGLVQGLVDGIVEPDRWVIDRSTKKITSHSPGQRDAFLVLGRTGFRRESVQDPLTQTPPLNNKEVLTLLGISDRVESILGMPQHIQWTFKNDLLWVLQSQPAATLPGHGSEDKRLWYLSLRTGFENLKTLCRRIEEKLIPDMIRDAALMAEQDLAKLSDGELVSEIKARMNIENSWMKIYWDEFIPLAHGVRLFGQVYNDAVRPQEPYEFLDLLASTGMESLKRNRMLEEMAAMVRNDPTLQRCLKERELSKADGAFLRKAGSFVKEFGDLSYPITGLKQGDEHPERLMDIVLEMAAHPPVDVRIKAQDLEEFKERFLNRFEGRKRTQAAELLDLARKSYQLRNDDNIHLARIEAQKLAAIGEAMRRLRERESMEMDPVVLEEIARASEGRKYLLQDHPHHGSAEDGFTLSPKQLTGQPASRGICEGKARVILGPSDLAQVKHGEILVCDVVDPNMTFVVPLVAGIVERRGGMLVHGAVIAREYGLPCVTGVSNAATYIRTGDFLNVNGHLGIVTLRVTRQAASKWPSSAYESKTLK